MTNVSPVLVGGSGLKPAQNTPGHALCVSPVLVGGSGLKPGSDAHEIEEQQVSPVLVGGSGLKLDFQGAGVVDGAFLPSWWAGVD